MTDRLSAFLGDVLGSPAGLREALGASLPEEATGIGRGRPIVLTGATVHVRCRVPPWTTTSCAAWSSRSWRS